MSGEQVASSFGDAVNAQPPTPQQTPTSAVFPSPVFETPKVTQGSFNDSGGWTPRFAEEYSVFNSTPGNLRGADGPFADFAPGPATPAHHHKRLLSAEGFAVDIAAHANHYPANPNLPLPPVDPSRRLPSSPGTLNFPREYPSGSQTQQPSGPGFSNQQPQSAKKARRGTVSEPEPPTQTATPPPTSHRGERKLPPTFTMQNDQSFGQPDFTGISQQQEMTALMAGTNDMFGYPMPAPPQGQPGYWEPTPMGMDLDFNMSGSNTFQAPTPGHRHTGSFDWNSEIQLFQAPSGPPPPANQENVQPAWRERTIAPKPTVTTQATTAATAAMTAAFSQPVEDPFGMMNVREAVEPGLLFSRPQSSTMNLDFNSIAQTGSAEAAIAAPGSWGSVGADLRRSSSFQGTKTSQRPDRTAAGSPVKSSRPGLGRSVSESRGKKGLTRSTTLPTLAPAARPAPQAGTGSSTAQRAVSRPSGRLSPSKSQNRLSSLASIPESTAQQGTLPSVRLTVDSRGFARAEAMVVAGKASPEKQASRDPGRKENWESCEEDSSTDDEPIIIPSRNNSFNASFALPDPRKPVGSIFHSSRRSISDRSTSTLDVPSASHNDAESEAETVMNDNHNHEKGGNALNELRRVKEDRQKRSAQLGRSQRFLQTNLASFQGNSTASPSTLTNSNHATDPHIVRCVCHETHAEDGDGFMVQCESCEMWLHGKCINISQRTLPRVYICAFCARTPNMRGGRTRDTGNGNSITKSIPSSLTNKSFRSFR